MRGREEVARRLEPSLLNSMITRHQTSAIITTTSRSPQYDAAIFGLFNESTRSKSMILEMPSHKFATEIIFDSVRSGDP